MKQLFTSPILRAGALLLVCAALIVPAHRATAQTNVLCFTQPGITNCLGGRFLQFWQQNGGLDVFGYPKTAQTQEQTPEGNFTTQYLERQRFELQPANAAPYDVLLGRLGDQLLRRQGIDWTTLPKASPNSPNYFSETGHSVPQQFYNYWSSNGLLDPALNQYQRSLALFGLPLTEAYQATNSSGDNVLTQWFERARFEYHPNNPPRYQVLLGLLGNEWLATPPPPAQSITITSPPNGATVGNPFTATGTTTVIPNGSTLLYAVYDANNNVIGQNSFGVVPSGSGSQWSVTVNFNPPPNPGPISLAVLEPGQGGRPPVATARIGLNYAGPPQQQSIRVDEPTRDQQYSRSPMRVRGATTLFPQRSALHFILYQAGGLKLAEGDFPVSASGGGSTFDHTLNFSTPNQATYMELELSDRDVNGNTIAEADIRVYFNPGGYPPPAPPPPPSGQTITINSPSPGTLVGRNFQATGTTSLQPPNGGLLNYGVLDNTGVLIGQGQIFAQQNENNSIWAAEISFSGGNPGTPITLVVDQPGGGPGEPPVARTSIQLQCCQ